jgi:hypothetical protein
LRKFRHFVLALHPISLPRAVNDSLAAHFDIDWNFATRRTYRAVLFVLLLILTSMLMCKLFLIPFYRQFTMWEKCEPAFVQSLIYVFCASWAFTPFFESDYT